MSEKLATQAAPADSQWQRPGAVTDAAAAQNDPAIVPPARKPRQKKPKADPYDDPLAPQPRLKNRRRRVDTDPYDDPLAEERAAAKKRRTAENSRRRAPTRRSASGKKTKKAHSDDPYDLLISSAEAAEKSRVAEGDKAEPKRPRKRGGSGGPGKGGWLTFVLCSLIAICLMVGLWQLFQYHRFNLMKNAVENGAFFQGTWVDGVDISGMTLEAALAHWESDVEPGYSGRSVTLDDGSVLTAADAGYSSNYREVIQSVWDAQQEGTVQQRYARMKAQQREPSGHGVDRVFYTDEALSEFTAKAAGAVDTPVTQARLTGFDSSSQTFLFEEGVAGKALDQEKLAADVKAALDAGGGSVTRQISETRPDVTVDDIKGNYGMRSSATTNASSSSSNRLNNISMALSSIDGFILKPGEEFSFNSVVGQRTAERGYKMAAAYSGGEVTEELGGGICQVSTTLFNAAVKADLEITERRAHSMPVSYVDKGKDATVSWGSQDLKFKNNTDAPICIVARLTSEKRVKIGIFGLNMPDGMYITVEAETDEVIDFNTTHQENPFLLPGTTNVLQEGRRGYKATAYKLYWAADGTLINKEVLCKSVYAKRDAIIEVGP
jgi:vancomycin resistance protein YoaR